MEVKEAQEFVEKHNLGLKYDEGKWEIQGHLDDDNNWWVSFRDTSPETIIKAVKILLKHVQEQDL